MAIQENSKNLPKQWFGAITALILFVVLGMAGYFAYKKVSYHTVTVYFPAVIGLYEGDSVRVLGVPVGKVDTISPRANDVKVQLLVDRDVEIPKNATAIIVAQSLVSGRFVQLTPTFSGGTQLGDGDIPMERTAVPVEWDQIKSELAKLSTSLGPKGTDQGGLARSVEVANKNFNGNGQAMGQSITELSKVMATMSHGRNDLFGTVKNLQKLTHVLADSKAELVQFNGRLASVSSVLANSTVAMNGALKNINEALVEVKAFLDANKSQLTSGLADLNSAVSILADRDEDLQTILHTAPNQLANFYNIYNPISGSLAGIFSLGNGGNLISMLCSMMDANARPGEEHDAAKCVRIFGPVISSIVMAFPPFLMNPITGAVARPNQVAYQNPDVRKRAQEGMTQNDERARAGFANKSIGELLVPRR